MGYGGGAPYWVQKQNESIISSSYQSSISNLEARIKELEAEKLRLTVELEEMKRKYEECLKRSTDLLTATKGEDDSSDHKRSTRKLTRKI